MSPFSVHPKETASMVTRDRVRLDADIYRPEAEGPFPVLLMRQPYGRDIASTVVYAHPTWYAAHGFIVVIQDVRGRGTSEGNFRLFEREVTDGYDTVEWAAQLPQSSGRVGMYGFSYQGMTQLFAAQAQPSALRAIAPAMVGYRPYDHWAYENGALLLQAGLAWAIQLAAETARLKGDAEAFAALYQASRQLPLEPIEPACPEVLKRYAPDSFFHQWISCPPTDSYWPRITPQLQEIDLPMLHIGGWFDPYLRGDVQLYQEMAQRSNFPQPLWIGPWGHIPWSRKVGDRDFGPAAESPIDRIQIDWFNHLLKDQPSETFIPSPVHLFEMGTNCWRRFTQWPQRSVQEWRLLSDGLAAMRQQGGRLDRAPLADQASPAEETSPTIVDTLVHDPWRPVPSLGGHAGVPSGPYERSALEGRSDILTYTTPALSKPLSVAGEIVATLRCWCDRPTFDLCLTLSEVMADGRIYPLSQGYGRFEASSGEWASHHLALQPTCFCIRPGHALRLSISAACYPAYTLNPGTVEPNPNYSSLMKARTITLAVLSGVQGNSTLSIPVVDNLPED